MKFSLVTNIFKKNSNLKIFYRKVLHFNDTGSFETKITDDGIKDAIINLQKIEPDLKKILFRYSINDKETKRKIVERIEKEKCLPCRQAK